MANDEDIYRTIAFSRAHCDDLADAATALKQVARGGKTFYTPTELRRLAATLGVLEDRWEIAGTSEQVFSDPRTPVPFDWSGKSRPVPPNVSESRERTIKEHNLTEHGYAVGRRPVPPNQCEHGYTLAALCPDCPQPYSAVEREHVAANVSLLSGWKA